MNEKMKTLKKASLVLAICTLGLVSYFSLSFDSHKVQDFAFAQSSSISIITLTNDNNVLSAAEYIITPDPFKLTGTLTIKDNSSLDSEKDSDGIINISGVKNGNYVIRQMKIPSGYLLDKFPKTIEIRDSSVAVSFTNNLETTDTKNENPIQNITYTAKFVCGSVFGNEGPLRPGHYDTDISIFNKQNFPITILWNIVINDGASSNSILKNLDEETSTAIVCKQIRDLLDLENNNGALVEGFAIIRIQLDSMIETGNGKVLRDITEDEINLLDVQAFYTANALPTLPHEVIVDKISFYIIQDESGMIPDEMMRKPLDVSIPSQLNEISNTEARIKDILAEKYNLSEEELAKVVIRIKNVSVGVGVLIDDHAISLHVIKPQAGS